MQNFLQKRKNIFVKIWFVCFSDDFRKKIDKNWVWAKWVRSVSELIVSRTDKFGRIRFRPNSIFIETFPKSSKRTQTEFLQEIWNFVLFECHLRNQYLLRNCRKRRLFRKWHRKCIFLKNKCVLLWKQCSIEKAIFCWSFLCDAYLDLFKLCILCTKQCWLHCKHQ